MRPTPLLLVLLALGLAPAATRAADAVECDLLIVGGGESGVAAAIQAARGRVKDIVLANDCDWLGGQFTAEGLCAVDEWTKYKNGRAPFPRSGLFLEIMSAIEADMEHRYGLPRPGNCFCAWTTCEPRVTEGLFRKLIAPHLATNGGPIRLIENVEPTRVTVEQGRITQVEFRGVGANRRSDLVVRPRLTIDAGDWGDVVRLSGARFFCGPDLRERFDEPSAPADYDEVQRTEINPITYCLVLRDAPTPAAIPKPERYDERRYYAATTATREEFQAMHWPAEAMKPFAPAWRDTKLPKGPYTEGPTVYHHRRLVDRRHNGFKPGTELVLVNWPLQDYPTNLHPKHVADALDQTEKGASLKNLPDLNPDQRRIIFDDAKLHALGLLYHLQTTVADRDLAAAAGKPIVTFRDLQLTDEFGTPDRLPLKPYVREGLRTDCLYMLREQDVRDTDGNQCWARTMPADGLFGFQFNIDFHPTKRIFADDDPSETWTLVHTKHRNWSTDTDRSMMPLRSFVPREINGLLVAGKNLGMSSIVQSAVRLHGHGMLAGQAAGTIAVLCIEEQLQPREVAADSRWVAVVQDGLIRSGVLVWPYHDISPQSGYFRAANLAAIRGLYVADDRTPDFSESKRVTLAELEETARRSAAPDLFRQERSEGKLPTRRELVLELTRRLDLESDRPRRPARID